MSDETQQVIDDVCRAFDGPKSESPIEYVMLLAIYGVLFDREYFDHDEFSDDVQEGVFWFGRDQKIDGEVMLMQQAATGGYRADFMLMAKRGESYSGIAIECDGHDFHEKTKEQARRDKARDRWFQSKDIPVFRFTGSEIWRDPRSCAEEACAAFFNLAAKKWA